MKNSAFTLIETLVAISLLTVGVVGSFSLMQKVTSFASISSSQFVASYLAQEGIEIIRNIRDTNYLERQVWDNGIGVGVGRLDYRSEVFPDATCGNYLKYSEITHTYVCSSDSSGKFRRQITIEKELALKKIVVSVAVSWSERGIPHQVVAQSELYNWR